jgi:hypothetical protein
MKLSQIGNFEWTWERKLAKIAEIVNITLTPENAVLFEILYTCLQLCTYTCMKHPTRVHPLSWPMLISAEISKIVERNQSSQ